MSHEEIKAHISTSTTRDALIDWSGVCAGHI